METSNGAYRSVDEWDFGQEFKDPGDGTSAGLWLASITHTGVAGSRVVDPPVTFVGEQLPNRVGDFSGGAFPMIKFRMSSIRTESGSLISVNYSAKDCTSNPAESTAPTNTRRCFPVYWTREGGESPTLHWFHKYVVNSVSETDIVGDSPTKTTTYSYAGSPGWHFDDNELTLPKYRTWGDWRGYNYVTTLEGPSGNQTATKRLFFRGLHGDRLNKAGTEKKTVELTDSQGAKYSDFDRLSGYVREEVTYNGSGGAEITGAVNTPWLRQTGSGDGDVSTLLGTGYTRTRTRLSDGSYRVAGVDSTFDDELGLPTSVNDLGDVSRGDDDRCRRISYAQNRSAWIMETASREELVSASCAVSTPSRPAQVISDERTYYDQHTAVGTAPSRGLLSKVESMASWNDGPVYEQRARVVHDGLGRTLETFDGLNRKTSTVEYTPEAGGPVTGTVTRDALGNVSRTTLDPAWGSPTVQVDANDRRTDIAYDGSGRLTSVWLPDRLKSAGKSASMTFSYQLSKTAGQPNVVSSRELLPNGGYRTSTTLLDGLLRERQTQATSANGYGRVITDTKYGNRGVVESKAGPYFNDSSGPSTKILAINDIEHPSQTVYSVDGANRVIAEIFKSKNSERWRTTSQYGGNFVGVDPPAGQTATMTVTDVRGKTVELRQYLGGAVQGASDNTHYTYTPRDELATVKNAGGSTWQYTYDLRGRQVSASDPDKGLTTSSYDDADRLVSTKDARGQILHYEYDALDRQTALRNGGATGTVLSSWKYDSLGKGLLTSSTRTVAGHNYVQEITGYDALNRPTGTRTTIPATEGKLAGEYTTSTKFNPDGSIAEVEMPRVPGLPDETMLMAYGAGGQLEALGGWSPYVNNAKYTPFGEPTLYEMGQTFQDKGVFQSFNYDQATHRMTWMKVDRQDQPKTDDSFDYTYDAGGNVVAIAHSQQQGAAMDRQCFSYDHLRRLTEARSTSNASCTTTPTTSNLGSVYPYWKTWEYWKSGNRSKQIDHTAAGNTTHTYSYPTGNSPRPHAVTGVTRNGPAGTSADTYGYDAAGNLATRTEAGDTDNLTWDAEGNLTSVAGPQGKTDFLYDAEGERLIKRDPTGTTLYLGDTEVRLDKTTDAASSTRYYKFNGSTVAMRTGAVAVEILLADHHGTATVSVDRSTNALSRRWMDPFGVPRGQSSTWESNGRGFVDGKADESTGLTRLGARDYDPELGRFITVDPLVDHSNPQQLNAYAYANNSPVSMTDPDGLMLLIDLPSGQSVGSNVENESGLVNNNQESVDRWNSVSTEKKVQQETERYVSYHKKQKAKATQKLKRVIKDLTKIIADELGITDALDCALNGDISSCISTGANVLMSAVGGIAARLIAKYALKFKKAKALGLRVFRLLDELAEGVNDWRKATKALESCRTNSFTPDTRVLMADGSVKPIGELKLGEKVLAVNEATGKSSAKAIVGTIVGSGQKELVKVSVVSDSTVGDRAGSVVATSGHPFYVPSKNQWMDAELLQPGDQLLSSESTRPSVVIGKVSRYSTRATVHNLTIDGHHTYFVMAGASPVLVHNSGGGGGCGVWTSSMESAGDVVDKYKQIQKDRDPSSQWYHEELSNNDLLSSINDSAQGEGIMLISSSKVGGGNHRLDELRRRVADGRIDAETRIRVDRRHGEG